MKRICVFFLFCGSLWGSDFRAGTARIKITPPLPMWLSGYAARTRPADSVLLDLWAKALVIEDGRGGRTALVTMDLIGLPANVTESVAARAKSKYGLERSQLLLNSSHTHSGPIVRPNLKVLYDLSPADEQVADNYSKKLGDDLVTVIGQAMENLAPAVLQEGHATADFAVNRRQATAKGVQIGVNPGGPGDHDVPVLKVTSPEGRLRAVLFGYACHNTTLGGDSYSVNGDYAGFALVELEKQYPGVQAMFLELCGADQNPSPRGTVALAEKYGKTLAEAVGATLGSNLRPVRPPLRTAYRGANLEFAQHTRKQFEDEMKGPDRFRQRRAKLVLAQYDAGHPPRGIICPVQAIRFNDDLTILALGGEVVVDYDLRAKREHPGQDLVVAGYSNEVMAYIPSKRVLQEGGYEPVDSMIYYGQPGPFRDDVEERMFSTIRWVLRKVGMR